MNIDVKSRLALYNFFKKRLTERKDVSFLNKKNMLGKGGQGTVYKYCLSRPKKYCTAVKKMYLDETESKYVDDIYSDKAYKKGVYIELSSMQLTNELVLQNVCPNYILNYSFLSKAREGICDDVYPYKMYFFNEYLENAEIYTEWVKKSHTPEEWYNAYFQITVAMYALQRYFNMMHLDLHSDNIIVVKVRRGGYWVYEIDKIKYYVPNYGYVFYINDFGHAWIPDRFRSWFIRQRYNKKKIRRNFDVMKLFKSTLSFSKSSPEFKKQIRYLIKRLREDNDFKNIINELWGDYAIEPSNPKIIDTYDLDKRLKKEHLDVKLRPLVLGKIE